MNKHPSVYNAVPYNYSSQFNKDPRTLKQLPFRQTFLDTISEDYYQTCKQSKIITFDSGEYSMRRKYIESTLIYLLQVKGIPVVAISGLNRDYTDYYLTKVPTLLRSKVLDLGIFHLYNNITTKLREILQLLYTDVRYRATIDYFCYTAKTLESKLIRALNKLGITVILDRSLISTFIYNNSLLDAAMINNSAVNRTNILNLEALRSFKPYASFFVHSEDVNKNKLKDIDESFMRKGTFYDSFDYLNFNIRGLLPQLKKELPFLVELFEYQSFETNMHKIKETLKDL